LNHVSPIQNRRQEDGENEGEGSNEALVQELQRLKDNLVAYSSTAASAPTAALITRSGSLPLSPPLSGAEQAGGPTQPPLLAATGKGLSLDEDNPLHSQIRDLRSRLEQKEVGRMRVDSTGRDG
jgi:hypothetical protein